MTVLTRPQPQYEPAAAPRQRRRLTIHGIVQGVGFRPFLHRLARELALTGEVFNFTGGVRVEVEGTPEAVEAFTARLPREIPPLAQIESLEVESLPVQGSREFVIVPSREEQTGPILVSPEIALCADCRRELRDPADRRYRHPFINCTNCGPRFTIVRSVPYDRPATSMSVFPMCPACRAEYENIEDRRYHAQPVACPGCGPTLSLYRPGAETTPTGEEALAEAQRLLREGRVIAVKGLGGFHLACDATSEAAVTLLRERKGREGKPFAVMVASQEVAEGLVELDEPSRELLTGPRAPIVLARKREPEGLAPSVAPESADYGVMLPYTPLHVLLFEGLGMPALVMTSANLSEEPLCTDNEEAHQRLAGLADAFLEHDRAILTGCDDSVLRASRRGPIFLRRSRGYVPLAVPLDREVPRVLAVGGHYKNTFCLTTGRHAFLSQHIGDLADADNLAYFERGVAHLEQVWQTTPATLACDLHPNYLSTRYARRRAEEEGLPLVPVQHHHAHLVSVLADCQELGPAVGLICDGTGYGADGTAWGCEILVGDESGYVRAAHLRNIALPGGEAAIHEPWRVAAAYLREAFGPGFEEQLPDLPFCRRLDPAKWQTLDQMIARGVNSPLASSAGRLFDAVATLLGLTWEAHYEGEPAMALEAVASRDSGAAHEKYGWEVEEAEDQLVMDVRPMIRALVGDLQAGRGVGEIAADFQASFVRMMVEVATTVAGSHGLDRIAVSGGTFQNRFLLEQGCALLESKGLRPLWHRNVPPNDGGIALGQALVAAATAPQGE